MTKSGIYKIVNLINNKIYIGSAVNLTKRRYEHFSEFGLRNKHLQRAMKKYGKENFEFIVLEYVQDRKQLILKEQFYLDQAKDNNIILYNIALKAGSNLGIKRSPETLRKFSLARRGHPVSDEQREKSRQRMLGNKHNLGKKRTPEQIENIRRGHIGQRVPDYVRQLSLEARKNRPSPLRGRKWKEEQKQKLKGRIPWNKNISVSKASVPEIATFYLDNHTLDECSKQFQISVFTLRRVFRNQRILRTHSQASALNHRRR